VRNRITQIAEKPQKCKQRHYERQNREPHIAVIAFARTCRESVSVQKCLKSFVAAIAPLAGCRGAGVNKRILGEKGKKEEQWTSRGSTGFRSGTDAMAKTALIQAKVGCMIGGANEGKARPPSKSTPKVGRTCNEFALTPAPQKLLVHDQRIIRL